MAYKKDKRNITYISAVAFRPYSEYKAYEKFRGQIEEDKENAHINKVQNKLLTIALESVQTDINDLKEKALKEYKEATEKTFEIAKREGTM